MTAFTLFAVTLETAKVATTMLWWFLDVEMALVYNILLTGINQDFC